jgi:N-acetylglutamate synthase-like GNAT family acetyltransferase
MQILPFEPIHAVAVVDLVVSIQRGEFGIDITAAEQPDLHDVPGFSRGGGGEFWVAVVDGRVVGTIALLDIGNRQGALRKMFVHRDARGAAAGTASRLLETLVTFAGRAGLRELFLGTTEQFVAAHRFYHKHGFAEIDRRTLPPAFPVMHVDTRFFHRVLGASGRQDPTTS